MRLRTVFGGDCLIYSAKRLRPDSGLEETSDDDILMVMLTPGYFVDQSDLFAVLGSGMDDSCCVL